MQAVLCRSGGEWLMFKKSSLHNALLPEHPPNSLSQTVWEGRSLDVSSRHGRLSNYGGNSLPSKHLHFLGAVPCGELGAC